MTERLFFRKLLTAPNFFKVFSENLDIVFPNGWIYDIEECGDIVCAVEGTGGWQLALEKTCAELNIYDAYKYWNDLDWEESDLLDADIGELLCAVVYDENNQRVL